MLETKRFSPPKQRAFDARFEAQKIAFGPVVFHCVRYAWKRGMLQALGEAGERGITLEALEAGTTSLKAVCEEVGCAAWRQGCGW